jgi:hypothetical protein
VVSDFGLILVADPTEIERDLHRLEAELKRLEAEYNMFFGGRLPRPPWETRSRVELLVKRYDRLHITNTGLKFRFTTLQSRFATFVDLWDRGLRAREEGRTGPFSQKRSEKPAEKGRNDPHILHVASFTDPIKEQDKLHDLYDSLVDARREIGESAVPFHKFAELVKTQVKQLRENGSPEVAFRVAVKEGKVSFTARALKGAKGK